ncbi:heme exporter protein CcmD [Palleronia abyssalis]|uniref:Heme exporter protein D n=1 Tax=Palleronia abyssalis TaxID=1501240 RepID=A0A2R8BUB9_9RHOB|nr:heme exporter protein CcmD [Palleronia abyssalis]SPJ23748.1 hypothetical protein PAA8504_01563 [Palleronia abyssalis]
MPDLGKYALEVGLAYGASAVLLLALVGLSVLRAARVRRQLEKVEARRG